MQHSSQLKLTARSILRFASLLLITATQTDAVAEASILDPNAVHLWKRETWCQENALLCGAICLDRTLINNCDTEPLVYDCSCATKLPPYISPYSFRFTLPVSLCETVRLECPSFNDPITGLESACFELQCGGTLLFSGGTPTTALGEIWAPFTITDQEIVIPFTVGPTTDFVQPSQPVPSDTSSTPTTDFAPDPTQPVPSDTSSTPTTDFAPDPTRPTTITSETQTSFITSLSSPSIETTGTGEPGNGDGGKKGLSTGAAAGIGVGIGVPILLIILFLVYKWGGRRAIAPLAPAPSLADKYPQQHGGNEIAGGGGYPGIGDGNQIGGIEGAYGSSNR
ncbi:hypothetical protein TWF718_009793 [Orbilia javanica]|uniref:DUF7707 domain-containing protein n=1 Tax=Orbilia javanica TaxID=47235 RepID=A0AAN8MT17_9PEZI